MARLHGIHTAIVALCILALSIPAFSANAGTLDFFLLTGYGLPAGGYTDTFLCSREYNSGNEFKKEVNHYLNYGKGLQVVTGFEYYFQKILSMRLSLCYTKGFPPLEVSYVHADGNIRFKEEYTGDMFGINLKLIPHVPINKSASFYAGAGAGCYYALLSIAPVSNNDTTATFENGSLRTSPGLGLNGVLGIDYFFTGRTAVFFECSFDQISFNLEQRKNTNGSVIDYKKDSPDSPAPVKIPGSNVGFRLGIKITLVKPSEHS